MRVGEYPDGPGQSPSDALEKYKQGLMYNPNYPGLAETVANTEAQRRQEAADRLKKK